MKPFDYPEVIEIMHTKAKEQITLPQEILG